MTRKRSCVVREGAEGKGPALGPRPPPTSCYGYGAWRVRAAALESAVPGNWHGGFGGGPGEKGCVSQYLACGLSYYVLSYRDLEEMMDERGLRVDHTTIYRWVQCYAPELERRCRPHLKATTAPWRVDETYVKVKGSWIYLYRAVDSAGNTLEFLLSATRDAQAAKRFFRKALGASHTMTPRVITADKNAAYPKAFHELQAEGAFAERCELRQSKYLNNVIEQDHGFIKRLVKPGLGFCSFQTAWRTLQGYEVMNMIRKWQVRGVEKGPSPAR